LTYVYNQHLIDQDVQCTVGTTAATYKWRQGETLIKFQTTIFL